MNLPDIPLSNEAEALLIRDLSNWLIHTDSASTSLNKSEFELAAHTIKTLWDTMDSDVPKKSRQKGYETFLRAIMAPESSTIANRSIFEHTDSFLPFLLCYNNFQAKYSPDEWFSKWTSDVKLPSSKRFRRVDNYLHRVMEVLEVKSDQLLKEEKSWRIYQKNWQPTCYEKMDSGLFFDSLLSAKSLEDLSCKTGINDEILPVMVEEIQKACSHLLAKKKDNSVNPVRNNRH